MSIAAEARPLVAARVIESLEPYKTNARLTERLRTVLAERGDGELERIFIERWGTSSVS